jgi:hypothetical protein
MGKATKRKRHFVIKKREHRREKVTKLKAKYLTVDAREREKILAKMKKVAPEYPLGELEKTRK